jgi:hypothetical protein
VPSAHLPLSCDRRREFRPSSSGPSRNLTHPRTPRRRRRRHVRATCTRAAASTTPLERNRKMHAPPTSGVRTPLCVICSRSAAPLYSTTACGTLAVRTSRRATGRAFT